MNKTHLPDVNNELYHDLGVRWYTASDDPVALLRAEAKTKNPWVKKTILNHDFNRSPSEVTVLDVGCGGGFLTNDLAKTGYQVFGLDASESSLAIAKQYDESKTVNYILGDAYQLPFSDATFDVLTCMDFLEHVENPAKVIAEAARVLKPEGLFIYHTFNRNWIAYLVIIKGVEWFVKNTPPHLHVLHLFLKPGEVAEACIQAGLRPGLSVGIAPRVFTFAFLKLLFTRQVPADFSFQIISSTQLSYLGYAKKESGA